MLYRNSDSQEGYIHICDDAHRYRKDYIKNRPQVFIHDVKVYMYIDGKFVDIKYCPYCGKKIEGEERTNEYYKF